MSDVAKQTTAAEGERKAESDSKFVNAVPESADSEPGQGKPPTPEEQMALYEKELKENDWGHQPC